MSIELVSANIKNFRSLGDLTLNFKDLTILVGCNSSGKSNSLQALSILSLMLKVGSPPPAEFMQRFLRFGENEDITFSITVKEAKKTAEYTVSMSLEQGKLSYSREQLLIGKHKVIEAKNGVGKVRDEKGRNAQIYQSKAGNLALKSAGDFGDRPFTGRLAEFIINWDFYDLDPKLMRGSSMFVIGDNIVINRENIPSLGSTGGEIQDVLQYWAEHDLGKFQVVSQELDDCLGISLKLVDEEGEKIIKVLEKDSLEIPLSNMSDGTLRIMAYYVLLHQDQLPTLIGIEEPERNLHPGLLREVASVVKRLSQKTQVIITTHSSQLLDCFNLDEINSDVSVLLLSKRDDVGTQAFPVDELGKSRDDLSEWMRDFGVGSAIYHSHLLQEILEQ
ncbi:AAA family ATPase [Microcoleus sp. bin38.metabat.b11b12b14.051]|uniref:AAA family ATPase n=1 Tax=Microcoleus sp. bin38.metabat.b11b12b14.051 TaxID=2742709 RepID=UPI0025E27006|nr:AAA family ATPase [Microcoleus sp. bin38.metabat.b11b12b14.051]